MEDLNQEEEYDPTKHRAPEAMTSDFIALLHLFKSSLGNGIFFLPYGYRRTGYIVAIFCGFFIGILYMHMICTLVQCSQILCRRNRVPMLDFAKTAEASFLSGPPKIQKYGRTFGVLINVVVCLVHFQGTAISILYASTLFQQMIEYFSEVELNLRFYIIGMYPFTCLFGFPSFKYLAPLTMLGSIFILIGIAVTLNYLIEDFPDPNRLETFTQLLPIPSFCNLFLYALHNLTVTMPLENRMRTPHNLQRMLILNVSFNVLLYTTFGFLGYNKYMHDVYDTVVKNLPVDVPLTQTVKITVGLAATFSFGIAYFVPISIILPKIQKRFGKITEYYDENIFRIIGATATTILAIAIPQMLPLLGFLAALSMTTIIVLIPIVIETATKWETATRFLLVKNIVIFIIWMVLFSFGIIESAITIIKEYK
ncbi:proton-coupled amino acid transporter-like protein pathetic isoform X1 [Apis cerana]|uniref:proton-coupled amino acid transporter-like protein pathetic isoform X1 n=1 Tax=Apis cerana TaxID=7461 RepID=UPI0007E2DA12|nr:proton-coupled amino acid transporter-like protein pathetic isoform X1 [Apis cerana]XP_061929954.1 proton-coupled amino acid transporter-like protein pathetic isoform X1 [Apis cerana]